MDMPPEAEPVAPASRLTATASEKRMEPGMFRAMLVREAKPGTTLTTEPKPTAQAVVMMAPMEPLAPSLMAGSRVLAWFRFSRQATRMPHTRAMTMA